MQDPTIDSLFARPLGQASSTTNHTPRVFQSRDRESLMNSLPSNADEDGPPMVSGILSIWIFTNHVSLCLPRAGFVKGEWRRSSCRELKGKPDSTTPKGCCSNPPPAHAVPSAVTREGGNARIVLVRSGPTNWRCDLPSFVTDYLYHNRPKMFPTLIDPQIQSPNLN